MKTKLFYILAIFGLFLGNAQVGIGTKTPDASSILDITSTSEGVLIPRMTTAERDAIATPAEGLQVFNTTKKSLDIFVNGLWKSYSYPINSNLVYVYSLDDLPTPGASGTAGEILLETNKMYVFSGAVNIGSNYIEINGAGLRGTDPRKDQVISEISSGAVLRSLTDNGVNNGVYIKELAVVPAAGAQAYNFIDATTGGDGIGTNYVNIFSGSSVVGAGSVGEISGYRAITIIENLWDTSGGLKVGGNVGKLTLSLNNIVGISGVSVELLGDLDANDVDLANNYFVDPGNGITNDSGVKVNTGTSVDRGRLNSNLFRNISNPLTGETSTGVDFDSFSRGWEMIQNTGIPNSQAFSFINYVNNTTSTTLSANTWTKINGATNLIDEERFTAADNKITYNGVRPIDAKITASISATATATARYAIRIYKESNGNGTLTQPIVSLPSITNGEGFQITLNALVPMVEGDFIEVHLLSTTGTTIAPRDLQLRVTDQ